MNTIFAQEQKEILQLEQQLSKARQDTNRVKLLIDLGNAYAYSDLPRSIGYLQEGHTLSKQIKYPYGIARNAYLLGVSYTDAGEYARADSFIRLAEKDFRELGYTRDLAKVQNAWGSIMFRQGNYYAAGSHFSASAEMFDQVKDTTSSLAAYQNLIAVLGRAKSYDKAVAQSRRVLRMVEERKDSSGMAYALQGLIADLTAMKKFDEAFSYLKKALDLAETQAGQPIAAEIYSSVGAYYFARENYANALHYFRTALNMAEKQGDLYAVTNHHNSVGQCYLLTGDVSSARRHLLKGMELARKHQHRIGIQNLAVSLSDLYDSTRDYRNAYAALREHTLVKDSILNSEIRNYTSSLEAQYESNRKENEILQLQQEQAEKNFQISRRNTLITTASILILALLVTFYFAWRNFRNRQKLEKERADLLEERVRTMEKEKQIASLQAMVNGQEAERTRVARDLHDGVGGLFSTVRMYYGALYHDTPVIKENPLYRKTGDLIDNAAAELRKVAHNMMPEVLMKMGLPATLKDLCNSASAGRQLAVRLETYGAEQRLEPSTEIMLFRVAQELVNNIIKHADATEALIQLNQDPDRLSMVVEDNGRGFDTAAAAAGATMGMASISNRVQYLHGEWSIDSQPGVGTTVTIEVPLHA